MSITYASPPKFEKWTEGGKKIKENKEFHDSARTIYTNGICECIAVFYHYLTETNEDRIGGCHFTKDADEDRIEKFFQVINSNANFYIAGGNPETIDGKDCLLAKIKSVIQKNQLIQENLNLKENLHGEDLCIGFRPDQKLFYVVGG